MITAPHVAAGIPFLVEVLLQVNTLAGVAQFTKANVRVVLGVALEHHDYADARMGVVEIFACCSGVGHAINAPDEHLPQLIWANVIIVAVTMMVSSAI